ncbi:MAG: TonB-dependent receptor [Pseudomonadota bacterium]
MYRFSTALSVGALLAAGAMAQQAAPVAEEDEARLGTVVVSGQKIERTLQDTKESVALVSDVQIEQLSLLDLEDVYAAAANVAAISPNSESFALRGISQNSASTRGGDGELGSIYLDGVAYTGFATRFGPRDLWDVQQVEILRGPQSTNVGRNALVGAVVVQTNDPNLDEFEGAVRAQIGNFDTYSGEGMVNIPLTANSALRFTAEYFESDGFVDNILLDQPADPKENTTFRAKYLIEPTADLSIKLTGQYAETSRGWDIYRGDLTGFESRDANANLAGFEDFEGVTVALDVTYDFNENWSVQSITSYLDGDYERFNDDDNGPDGGDAFRGRTAEDKNWAEELRLSYSGEAVSGVAGIYYTEVDIENNTTGFVAINPALVGVPDTLLPFYPNPVLVNTLIPFESSTTNFAFFTEWDWQIAERWRLNGGFRFDQEDQDIITNSINTLDPSTPLPDPDAITMAFGPAAGGGVAQVNALLAAQLTPTDNAPSSTSYDAFLPQIGLTYDISNTVSVAAFYKRGYRAGGVDFDATGGASEFDPEYLDNFEVAYRSTYLDGTLIFNANAYYGLWTDQQLTVFRNGSLFDTEVINAGESTIYGAEFEIQYAPTDRTSLYASLGLAETEFDEFCFAPDDVADLAAPGAVSCTLEDGSPGQDLSGKDFAASPDLTWSIGGRQYVTNRFYVAGNATFQDTSFNDIQNTELFENDSATLVNLSAGYEFDQFEISVFGRNVFDEFYTFGIFEGIEGPDSRNITAGNPAEWGIILSAEF